MGQNWEPESGGGGGEHWPGVSDSSGESGKLRAPALRTGASGHGSRCPSTQRAQQALTDAYRTGRKQAIGLGEPQIPRPAGKSRKEAASQLPAWVHPSGPSKATALPARQCWATLTHQESLRLPPGKTGSSENDSLPMEMTESNTLFPTGRTAAPQRLRAFKAFPPNVLLLETRLWAAVTQAVFLEAEPLS